MDAKTLIAWLIPVIVRGIAWFLAVKLGMDATTSQDHATQVGQALGAIALVGVSIYTSLKGREKLLMKPPPVHVNTDPDTDGT